MNENELHDKAVIEIAKDLFSFPDSQIVPGMFRPTWATFTNVPVHKMPVEHQFLGAIYPDIVVVDTVRDNLPRLIAEVETKESLTIEKAIHTKWKPDTAVCGILYLFVPESCAILTADMILNYKICFPTAMFTYGFDETDKLRLTPV